MQSYTFRKPPWCTTLRNPKTFRTFLDQWEACLTIWGAERREERRRERSQSSLLTLKEGENWKGRRGGGGLRQRSRPAQQRSFYPAMVTTKTTRPPNLGEWIQFKCRHPPQQGTHWHTHMHWHFPHPVVTFMCWHGLLGSLWRLSACVA